MPAQTNPDYASTLQAADAQRFIDSMGINVHVESLATPYKNYPAINARLQALGMRHLRDEINDTDASFIKEIRQVGELGYRLCGLIEGGNDYPAAGTRLTSSTLLPIIDNLLPTLELVEGPNEPDDGGFAYDGVPYPQGAIHESEDLWNIVKGQAETKDLPVLALSEGNTKNFEQLAAITPPPIDYANYGNMHAYQGGSVGDSGLADYYIPYAHDLSGKLGLISTEMGYHNNIRYLNDGEQQGVSQRAAAIYLPIAFLSGFNRGVLQTYAYELIDEVNDPRLVSGSGEGHYGLLNYDGTPKPAFTALKNLISLLRSPQKQSSRSGSLMVKITGAPTTMHFTLLEKTPGVFYLAIWNDVSVYRVASLQKTEGADLFPSKVPVTLDFCSPSTVTVYAPGTSSGVEATRNYTLATSATSIRLALPPEVLLLRIVRSAESSHGS